MEREALAVACFVLHNGDCGSAEFVTHWIWSFFFLWFYYNRRLASKMIPRLV